MEALKRSLVFFWAAGMYLYHLGGWTYRMEGFQLDQLSTYPAGVLLITYAYVGIILVFISTGVLATANKSSYYKTILILLAAPALYELYRIFELLSVYSTQEQDLFYAHLGIRVSLGTITAYCIYHAWQLRNRFNKALNSQASPARTPQSGAR